MKSLWFKCVFSHELSVSLQLVSHVKAADPNENKARRGRPTCLQRRPDNLGMVLHWEILYTHHFLLV